MYLFLRWLMIFKPIIKASTTLQPKMMFAGTRYPVVYRDIRSMNRIVKMVKNMQRYLSGLAVAAWIRGMVSSGRKILIVSTLSVSVSSLVVSLYRTPIVPISCCRRGLIHPALHWPLPTYLSSSIVFFLGSLDTEQYNNY